MPDLQASHIYLLDGLILLALLLCSAIISGTEVAFFSLSHKQITQCKNSKDLRERGVVKLLKNPRRLLATILILNNLVNVAIVTLSTYLLWHVTGSEAVEGIVLFAYTLISTALIVLFGEVIPKIYANQNNLRVAKRLTGPLYVAVPLLYPLSSLLLRLGKLIGRKNQFQEHYDLSAEGLNRALELTTMQETSAGEREILKGVMTFSTLTVKQTMQPRTDIVAIDTTLNFHQLMDLVHKSSYSRFPVYRDTIDSVEGLLYTKDLMPYLDQDERFAWHKLLRKALFVPENKKIDALLLEFQEKRTQMAIVVDEYGGTSGLITMEDIIEEIIGDIVDEFDQEAELYRKLDDQTFIFEGKISLNDFCKAIGENPTTFNEIKGESESLAGLLLELHGRLPLVNETMSHERFTFTVVAADSRRIKSIKVEIVPQAPSSTLRYGSAG